MSLQDELIAIGLHLNTLHLALLLKRKQNKQKKRTWVKDLWLNRTQQGEFDNLVKEMRLSDHAAHFEHFRMSPAQFDELLNIVGPAITKKASTFREPIQPAMKLAITIRYLVDGPSMKPCQKTIGSGCRQFATY